MRDYLKLQIWQLARVLAKEIYVLTGKFPKSEIYGLVSQMRSSTDMTLVSPRAGVSVISNIGEGCRCDSNKEFIQFLRVSIGSVKELECQAYVSLDVGFINEVEFDLIMKKLDELSKKIWAYIKYLKIKDGEKSE